MPIKAKPDKPFRARRQVDQIEMVLIERSALLFLTALGRQVLEASKKESAPNIEGTHALQGAIRLAESALAIQNQANK